MKFWIGQKNLRILNCNCLMVKTLLQLNNSYFSKIVLESSGKVHYSSLGLQHKPENLDISTFWFTKQLDNPNTYKESRKNQRVAACFRCGICGVKDTNIKCLCYRMVEALEYLQLLGMRYGETKMQSLKEFKSKRKLDCSPAFLLNLNTSANFRTRYFRDLRSRAPATPKIKFFVKLVNRWKPLTNATKSFILDIEMVLDTSSVLFQNAF